MNNFEQIFYTVVEVLASGQLSDFVFNDVMAKLFTIIKSNFMLFWILAQLWVKFSKFTDNTVDDKLSGMLLNWLSKFRPNGGVDEKKTIRTDAPPVDFAHDCRTDTRVHPEEF